MVREVAVVVVAWNCTEVAAAAAARDPRSYWASIDDSIVDAC